MEQNRDEKFLLVWEPAGICLVTKQKKNCHHDHISFYFKGKLSSQSYSIKLDTVRTCKSIFLSMHDSVIFSGVSL